MRVLEAALAARSESASIRYQLATALKQTGEIERAREMLRSALVSGTFPEVEDARRMLIRLKFWRLATRGGRASRLRSRSPACPPLPTP